MNSRREFLVGSICLGAAATAYALQPRRRVALLAQNTKLGDIVPRTVGAWSSQDVSDLIAPKIEGSLMSRLYNETVGRVYTDGATGAEVMMLLAYGDTQSDDLQLHRPEICYPAYGFAISQNVVLPVDIGRGVSIPCRKLVADAPDRRETIIYWSRLGDYLPLDRKQQQLDRLRTALRGEVGDGLLARFSVLGADPASSIGVMLALIPALVRGVRASQRAALIATSRARALIVAGL